MFMRKRGQSTLEYALIIAVIVVALIAIMVYMRRAMLGRLKESSNSIGRQFDPENGYETAWQTQGLGLTITEEDRDTATGATTSNTIQAETIEDNKGDAWGDGVGGGGPGYRPF